LIDNGHAPVFRAITRPISLMVMDAIGFEPNTPIFRDVKLNIYKDGNLVFADPREGTNQRIIVRGQYCSIAMDKYLQDKALHSLDPLNNPKPDISFSTVWRNAYRMKEKPTFDSITYKSIEDLD